ncbi:hypothetical protein [Marinobacter sp. MDS2]|uniref:sensor histidine kinase n=1 Tax=Marinobacter sp. MDS2 TaxID=3065961 RepID=UPI00273A89D4|nr:hypothetical protein [Marinobacter sp. MDS2]MDP4547375.1 hypothetical protein [Marinobacter sp. MDS2]
MTSMGRWRYLASASLLLAVLMTAAFFHWGRAANLHAHDLLINTGVASATPKNNPLLVSVAAKDINRTTLIQALENLHALGANELIILPELSGLLFSSPLLASLGSTVFSDQLLLTVSKKASEDGIATQLQLPDSISVTNLPAPTFSSGQYRYVTNPSENSRHPFSPTHLPNQADENQGINFLFLSNGQPEVSLQQVASGQLIPALVEGKTILIELSSAGNDPGYAVPGNSETISALQIQGLIWSTLATDSAVEPYAAWVAPLLIGLLFVSNLILLQWLSPLQGIVSSLVISFLLVTAYVLSLTFTFRIFPLTELLFTQMASLFFVFQAQRLNEDRAVASMLAESNSMLSERFARASFFESDNPWAKIVVLINQQLNLNRSILLEKVPEDHRVHEIQALNCSIDSIAEQRRDFQRTPYSTAIELGGPLLMTRQYFREAAAGEIEYLVPLQFANEIMGFWALAVQPGTNWNQAAFESNVSDFAAQISELLFHREQWQRERKLQSSMSARLAGLDGGRRPHRDLQNALNLLEKRLDEMEDVFAGLGSAVLLYDLFGQITQTNQMLEQLARESGFSPFSLTAAELLCEVCELNLEEARRELRHVTLKQKPVFLPVKPLRKQNSYMLHVRAVKRTLSATESNQGRSEADPFQLIGILFEFVDVSHTQELLAARDDVLAQFSRDIRSPLNRITLAANRLKKLNPSDEAAAKVESIDSAVTQAVKMMEGMSKINSGGIETTGLHSLVPINPLRLVKHALTLVEDKAQGKGLRFIENWPFQVTLALVNNEVLRQLLRDILVLLINDATPDSSIAVLISNEMQAGQRTIVISLTNEGYGLPKSTMHNLLERPASLLLGSSDLLEHTIGSLQHLAYWGADFEADSQTGQGFSFSIRLREIGLTDSKPA